jgi:indole-3-glycerol phosphate synthase
MTREYHEGYQQGYKDAKEEFKEPILDKIFCIVHPLSIMSTPELEHKAIMQIAEMLEPLCLPESEDEE